MISHTGGGEGGEGGAGSRGRERKQVVTGRKANLGGEGFPVCLLPCFHVKFPPCLKHRPFGKQNPSHEVARRECFPPKPYLQNAGRTRITFTLRLSFPKYFVAREPGKVQRGKIKGESKISGLCAGEVPVSKRELYFSPSSNIRQPFVEKCEKFYPSQIEVVVLK